MPGVVRDCRVADKIWRRAGRERARFVTDARCPDAIDSAGARYDMVTAAAYHALVNVHQLQSVVHRPTQRGTRPSCPWFQTSETPLLFLCSHPLML